MVASRQNVPQILVADDDHAMCELMSELTGEHGQVTMLVGGASLREYLQRIVRGSESMPDLLVSDVRMPGFGGLDALAFIRRHLPSIRVILVTAFGDALVHRRAGQLGASALLNKPFKAKALQSAIHDALARSVSQVHESEDAGNGRARAAPNE